MRVVERLLSVLLALALVAGAVVLCLEVGWAMAGKPPLLVPWHGAYDAGLRDSWDSSLARVIAIVLVAVGLLLLVVTLKPRRPTALAMTSDTPGVRAAITRRSLRSTLLAAAGRVDGVHDASATVRKRRATVTAHSRLADPGAASGLTSQLDGALRSRLEDLQLASPPGLKVRVQPRRGTGSH